MRIVRYVHPDDDGSGGDEPGDRRDRAVRSGLVIGGAVIDLADSLPDDVAGASAEVVVAHLDAAPADPDGGGPGRTSGSGRSHVPLADVRLLPPVVPGKIVAVGRNYKDHAAESGSDLPAAPLLFAKFPSAVIGPHDAIERPATTTQLDYEAELGVVIGRRARHVTVDDALDHVAGYLAVNDVTDREAQYGDGQWLRGKSMDTFAPLGPALVTADEVGVPDDLEVSCRVNGELRQRASTSLLIFPVAELIAYCSRWFTLEPGDVISTGAPAGVGKFMDPPTFLQPGDVVTVAVAGVGELVNPVAAGR